MRKTNVIFVVYEVLKILIFFSITYKKSWHYNTNNRQILNSKW